MITTLNESIYTFVGHTDSRDVFVVSRKQWAGQSTVQKIWVAKDYKRQKGKQEIG